MKRDRQDRKAADVADTPASAGPRPTGPHGPVPGDVRKAVAFIRNAIRGPFSMSRLVAHCGVPERTLNEHFRAFVGYSPAHYLRRLRLAAAREMLLAADPATSVTGTAAEFRFNNPGRFAGQYRAAFGETPSATLRRGRAAKAAPAFSRTPRDNRALRAPVVASRERPSIAILPCQAPASEPDLRLLAEGIAEGIAAALSSARSLAVSVPTSARAKTGDPRRAARELGARYVLNGRIVHGGDRLRLIIGLAETATGHHVWGEAFDAAADQPLELLDRVVAAVFSAIPAGIRGAEIDRAARTAPNSLDAYGLSMRALPFLFASRPDAARRALEILHAAIDIDPDYGLSAALAAWGHGQLVIYNGTAKPSGERLQSRQLAQRAAVLDDAEPIVLTARSAVHMMTGEHDICEALLTRALALDPTCGWAHGRRGWLHAYRGDSEQAIRDFDRSLTLGPQALKGNNYAGIGSAHFNAGRYEEAAVWLRHALLEQPGSAWANRSLAVSYARTENRAMALKSLDALRRYNPGLTVDQVVSALPYRPDFLERLGDGLSDLGLPH